MKAILFWFTLLITTTTFAQEKIVVDPTAKTRSLNGSFNAIEITDGIELTLSQGNEESIAISTGDEKYEDQFKTEVSDGVLKIYFDNKGINWSTNTRRKLRAYVSFKSLERIYATGGANVKSGEIRVENLEMKFTVGAMFNGKVHAADLTIDEATGAMVKISGTAQKCTIDVTSGALFKGYDFTIQVGEAKATSGASVKITVEKELSARASSGGDIHYKGTAVIKDIDISSGGIVKKA